MEQTGIKVYGCQWVAPLVYYLRNAILQMLWITFAPITSEPVAFYDVPAIQRDLPSLIFIIVYIFKEVKNLCLK